MAELAFSPRVLAWRDAGETERFRDRDIHAFRRAGGSPPMLLLHGFPSSSFDWRLLLEADPDRAALTFDFLGFGLSEKPRNQMYSLFWQADLAEELARRRFGTDPVIVVAHDMGTSVATELLARDIEGRLHFRLAGMLLFNGSVVVERSTLMPAQRALRSPFGAVFARLNNERSFRRQFGTLFSEEHPLSREEAADQWALIRHHNGRTLGHRLINYIDERMRYADRWHGAVRDWEGPLSFAWGERDPVSTTAVLDALEDLRPLAPVQRWPELGHYPQLEDPAAVADAVEETVRRAADWRY